MALSLHAFAHWLSATPLSLTIQNVSWSCWNKGSKFITPPRLHCWHGRSALPAGSDSRLKKPPQPSAVFM